VHGISVSGPTFPAEMWRKFMERAVHYAPGRREFPSPRSAPVWQSHTLQYAMTGGYYSPSSSGDSTPQTPTNAGNDSDGFVQIPEQGDEP
jgi:hypothetical protein